MCMRSHNINFVQHCNYFIQYPPVLPVFFFAIFLKFANDFYLQKIFLSLQDLKKKENEKSVVCLQKRPE